MLRNNRLRYNRFYIRNATVGTSWPALPKGRRSCRDGRCNSWKASALNDGALGHCFWTVKSGL